MALKYLTHINLNQNELQNPVIHPLGAAPSSPIEGQIYYNSTAGNKKVYIYDGTVWTNISGDITEVIAGNALTGGGAGGSVTLNVAVDDSTIEINSDALRVKAGGIGANELASTTVTAGSYGSSLAIPTFTVDADGRLTAAGTASITTTLDIAADSGTDNGVVVGTDTLTISGTANEIETSVSGDTITIGLPNNVTIAGDLTVNGTTTTINTQTLSVEDPLIEMANQNAANTVDTGFYANYSLDAGVTTKYAGLFKDASDSDTFKLFKGLEVEPTTTVDTAGTGYSLADLDIAGLSASSGIISGDLTVDTNTLYVDSINNRVGIGTTTPNDTLEIHGKLNIGDGTSVTDIGLQRNSANYITATNAAGYLVFRTGGANERVRIDTSGNVGIGTTSPASILDIQSNTSLAIRLGNSLGVNGYQLKSNVSSSADFGFVIEDYSGTDLYQIQAGSGGFHRFLIDGSEKMRITSSGRVGIGTTSPSAGLEVATTGLQGYHAWFGATGFINSASYHYDFAKVGFSVDDPDGADTGAGFSFTTRNSGDSNWIHGYIYQPQDGGIAFGTGGAGTTSATERMRIDSSGRVGIGITNPTDELQVRGNANGTISTKVENIFAGTNATAEIWAVTNGNNFRIVNYPDADTTNANRTDFISSAGGSYFTFSTAAAERMRIDPGGRIGIGTTSPSQIFTIENNTSIFRINTSTSVYPRIQIGSTTGTTAFVMNRTTGNQDFKFGESTDTGNYIFRGGKVGIGTDSPATTLEIAKNDIVNGVTLRLNNTHNGADWGAGSKVGVIDFYSTDTSVPSNVLGAIELQQSSASSTYASVTDFVFKNFGSGTLSETMRIDGSGNVGIGNTSPDTKLHITDTSSAFQFTADTGTAGDGRLNIGHFSNGTFIGTYGDDGGAADIIRFGTHSGDERMRIDSSGNVNIGSTSGNGQLNVGASNASAIRHAEFYNSQLGSSFAAGSFITIGRTDINRSIDVGIYGNGSNEFDGKILVNETGGSLILGTQSAERIRIDSTGRVGVGTASPERKLHAKDSSIGIASFESTNTSSKVYLSDSGTTNNYSVAIGSVGNEMAFYASSGGAERMRITSSGNVGINVSDPDSQLEIVNSSGGSIRLGYAGGTDSYFDSENFYIRSGSGGSNKLIVNASGNVGIGTTSPGAKLDISFTGGGDSIKSASTSSTSYNSSKFYNDNSKGWHNLVYGSAYSSGSLLNIGADGAIIYGNTTSGVTTLGAFDLLFGTNSTERMRINSSGNVGINETNPSTAKLVIETGPTSGIDLYRSAVNANFDAFRFRDSTNANTEASIGWSIDQLRLNSTNNTVLTTGGTERMRIDSSGRVGIGTTSINSKVQIEQPQQISGAFSNPFIKLSNSALTDNTGTTAIALATSTADNYGYAISAKRGTSGADSSFIITHHDNSLTGTERMRIDSSGRVGIGKTPSSWRAAETVIQLPDAAFYSGNNYVAIGQNYYIPAVGGAVYEESNYASDYYQSAGTHVWRTAASGTAGNTITWSERMRIDSSGNIGMNAITNPSDYDFNGAATVVGDPSGFGTLSIVSSATGVGYLSFADGSSGTERFRGRVDYDHSTDSMQFRTSGVEVMRIDSSGNVGIGTTSVDSKVHIESAFTASNYSQQLKIENTTTGQPSVLGMFAVADNGGLGNAGAIYFDAGADGSSANNILAFNADHQTDNNYDLVLTGNGNVGIGTDSPQAILHVSGVAPTYTNDSTVFYGGTTNNGTMNGVSLFSAGDALRGGISSNLLINNGTVSQTNTSRSSGSITFNNTTVGSQTSGIIFGGYVKGSTTFTERMRIDFSGNVGIGTTSPSNSLHLSADNPLNANIVLGNAYAQFGIYNAGNQYGIQQFVTGSGNGHIQVGRIDGSATAYNLILQQLGGNVGIGTTSPTQGNLVISPTAQAADLDGLVLAYNPDGGSNRVRAQLYIDAFNGMLDLKSGSDILTTRISSAGNSYFNNGNVGIGTSSPTRDLEVTSVNQGIATFGTSNTSRGYITFYDANTTDEIEVGIGAVANNLVLLAGNATERMRIDSSGNVGIGTTSPTNATLVIGKDSASAKIALQRTNANTTGAFGQLGFQNLNGEYVSGIVAYGDGDDAGSHLVFHTTSDAVSTDDNVFELEERMRITSGGSVLIDTTDDTPNGVTISSAFVSINDGTRYAGHFATSTTSSATAIAFSNPNGKVGSIETNGSATAYNTSSDYRLKENIVELTGALDRVDALKPSRFNFIADADKTVDGFLAHEVAEVVPEAISGEKDAVDEEGNAIYQGIDQSKLVPLLVGAIKELRAEINNLKQQINK